MSQKYESSGRRYHREGDKPKARARPRKMSKKTDTGSNTPPLLSRSRRSSIDDLIKKRETLKQELKNMKRADSDIVHSESSKYKQDKTEKHSNELININKKRSNDSNVASNAKKKKTNECTGDFGQVESEDEETLIEKSRQRRKEFLEKLKAFPEENQIVESKSSKELLEKLTASPEEDQIVESKSSKEPLEKLKAFSEDQIVESKSSNRSSKSPIVKRKSEEAEIKTVRSKLTDMFSEHDEFSLNNGPEKVMQDNKDENNAQLSDNWDDSEGYYSVRLGDEIDKNRYTIKDILGKGVFSNVVRAHDNIEKTDVAIKIIRRNIVTFKTGLKEIEILEQIREVDPETKHHCIKMFRHFTHKNHLCLVIEFMYMDLRHVIKKYGHRRGLNTKAIMSYSRQLLLALRLLNKIGVVHADIKPDNILINEKKNILKLCDFGSAFKDDQEATPYLVSRFYRAPEIILGVPYKHSIDIWSAACTIYEMATGRIMFCGSSNNKMLKCFMDLKGKMSARMIKRGKFKDQHFNYNNNFLLHKKEQNTGREKFIETPNISITRDLSKDLMKYFKDHGEIEQAKLVSLRDLLDKMLVLDPKYRYTVTECLKHPFIVEKLTETKS